MKPSTIWIAIVLLALGVCGILDAAGIVASSQTIAQWWPLAIVGWALAAMLDERRVTLGGVICAAIGLTLLADAQAWANGAFLWSSLAIAIGLAILVTAALRRGDNRNGDSPATLGKSAS
jgi:sugar phosphate permease